MSGRASGGGVKGKREQPEEKNQPSALQVAAHTKLLTLLAVAKSSQDMLVLLQLCDPQGVALFSFVHVQPRVPRPFAGARVYSMLLPHAERLHLLGCGLKAKAVRLLSLGMDGHFGPERNWGACHKLMQINVRHVAAGLAAAVRASVTKEAEELCALGQCAAAVVPLKLAIDFGDLPSRALMAWLLIHGREGVAQDLDSAFELAEEGARLGCHHCQGVMAYCYYGGWGCEGDEARSLELACESSGKGSRYGQFTLGTLHDYGGGGLAQDGAQAAVFYRLAATQGLDAALCSLGQFHVIGEGAEALRLYQLAAAQGYPVALFLVADLYEQGLSVPANVAEAIRWYRRAQAAGDARAADALQRLGA